MKLRAWSLVAGIVALAGCDLSTDPALSSPAVETDSASYTLVTTSSFWDARIAYSFTNATERPVSFLSCGVHPHGRIEKRVGGRWIPLWAPAHPDCLDGPTVVAPGAIYADTFRVAVRFPGPHTYENINAADLTGTFRLVLRDAVHEYDPMSSEREPDIPLVYRVSNRFTLRADNP